MKERIFTIDGLDCANCAAKLERSLNTIPEIKHAAIDFMTKRLTIEAEEAQMEQAVSKAKTMIARMEPQASVREKSVKKASDPAKRVMGITGLDCANCAAKVERGIREIPEVREAALDFMTGKLTLVAVDAAKLDTAVAKAKAVVKRVEPGAELVDRPSSSKAAAKPHIHDHDEHCNCGHDHEHEAHHHEHGEPCNCGHDHEHEAHHHDHDEHCNCGHDHEHEAHHHDHDEHCNCGHDHEHEEAHHHEHDEPCNCGHDHEHEEEHHHEHSAEFAAQAAAPAAKKAASALTAEHKKQLTKIIVAAVIFAGALLAPVTEMVQLGMFILSYVIVGGEIVLRALKNISRGQVFDENFLMMIASIGAFIVGEYPEGVAVILFYQVGELFQSYAVNRSRASISDLMDIRPEYANIKQDGEWVQVDPEEVEIGDTILVKVGEKVPLDGIVVEGTSMMDTIALTGESAPREMSRGASVLSGSVNLNSPLVIEVTKVYSDSTVAKILDLVENASSKKAEAENFITKFARYYTPIVVCIAALLAVIPPLLVAGAQWNDWIYRALIFLVISCPCALVISVPLSFFAGLGATSKCGVLVKGSNYLEALANLEIAVFDKTGTLTEGVFKVTEIHPANNVSRETLLENAAYAESFSNHPISKSLLEAYSRALDWNRIGDSEEIAGHGVRAVIDGRTVLAGNAKLMRRERIAYDQSELIGTAVHVAIDGQYAGYILISDQIKADAKQAISDLRACGVKQTVMLTGDNKAVGEHVAKELGLDQVYTELLPDGKVHEVEQLLAGKSPKGTLAFTGDGINDAPVLARADVGIAMGGLGSDAAIEAADVVIMNDEPSKIATAIKISKRTLRIVKQNIIFAIGVKLAVLLLGALGMATMWEAVFADVGVAVIAILNAIRVLNTKHID